MKKLIIPVLLLCLLLTACAQNTNPTQPSVTQPTSNNDNFNSDGLYIDVRLPTYKTLEQYKQFVDETELPDNFVYYENLSQFGEFASLVFTAERNDNNINDPSRYSRYIYFLEDEAGNRLGLSVGYEPLDVAIIESKYWGDMQAGDPFIDKTKACVVRNGISYLYLGGNLAYICWEHNGIHFCLDTDVRGEVFYPDDGPLTIVHELLHTDTNKAALEKIEAALNTPAVK